MGMQFMLGSAGCSLQLAHSTGTQACSGLSRACLDLKPIPHVQLASSSSSGTKDLPQTLVSC